MRSIWYLFFAVEGPCVLNHMVNRNAKENDEAQGLGALLDTMEDNDHIKLDNILEI